MTLEEQVEPRPVTVSTGKVDHLDPVYNFFPFYVASGMAFFAFVNYLTRYMVPDSLTHNTQSRWKWRNVLTSFIHSFITGAWAPWAFFMNPELGNDMIRGFNDSIHMLVSISVGYFIYDFFDMWIYHKKRSTYELLLHHFMVILCYTIAVATRTYVSYAALSLVVEINSVFLHGRQLFIIAGVSKQNLVYRSNALLNVASFVLFRILLLGWMTRWLTLHRDDVPVVFFTVGSLGLATIVTMNIILFYRVLVGDFGKKKSPAVTSSASAASSVTSSGGSPMKNVNGDVKSKFHSIDRMLVRSLADDLPTSGKKCQ